MGLFSRIKDVASGKVYRQNELVGTHDAELLKGALTIQDPFVRGWMTEAAISTSSVMGSVLLGSGIGEKSSDPLHRFRVRAKELDSAGTYGMVKIVMGYFLHTFLKTHKDAEVWDHLNTPDGFRSTVEQVLKFDADDKKFWREEVPEDEEPNVYFSKIFKRASFSVGLMPNPGEDLIDSLVFSELLTLMYGSLMKSLQQN